MDYKANYSVNEVVWVSSFESDVLATGVITSIEYGHHDPYGTIPMYRVRIGWKMGVWAYEPEHEIRRSGDHLAKANYLIKGKVTQ